MTRYECSRCGVVCFTTDPPHMCKDLAKRLARREAQVAAVEDILARSFQYGMPRAAAEEIVAKLAGMGVADD